MKITRVIPRIVRREMGGRLWNPRTRWQEKVMVLVFVEADTGQLGVGEAWNTAAAPEALVSTIQEDLAPLVLGEDPFLVERVWQRAFRPTELSSRTGIVAAALSAVDIALWDLMGQALNQPLYRLLGAHAEEVYCYASAGLYGEGKTPDVLAQEMAGYVAQGFTGVKMKVGGAVLAEDVRRVAAVREAVGTDVRLMVDAVYNLTVPEAQRLARAFAPYDIYWLEAPVSPYDVAGQARVQAAGPIPVCGNETEYSLDRFRELITADAVEFVQFDVAACGGISEGRRIADLARAFHRPCSLHAASSIVVMAASLHLGAALANCESLEYHMLHQWLWDRVPAGALAPRQGFVRPPPGSGLGLALTPDDV
jgi:L-alanine-DL-glutamate epimerase-like enolase superfamily enzyme